MGELDGRRALVTGGSRGIGRGIALALAGAGADVAIGYRRGVDAAEAVVKDVEVLGRRALAFAADVRDGPAVARMLAEARDALGGLDIVVANAGVPARFEPLHEVDPSYFDRVIQIDLYGVFHTMHAALPILREQGSGVLLTISSILAEGGATNGAPYVAAKAAVNAMTRVAARENAAAGVRCNVIAPGLVQTDISDGLVAFHGEGLVRAIPLGRIGTPEEVGRLAVYLASDAASWITGQVFRIDGGQL